MAPLRGRATTFWRALSEGEGLGIGACCRRGVKVRAARAQTMRGRLYGAECKIASTGSNTTSETVEFTSAAERSVLSGEGEVGGGEEVVECGGRAVNGDVFLVAIGEVDDRVTALEADREVVGAGAIRGAEAVPRIEADRGIRGPARPGGDWRQ
jgi:hypothetical protein